MVGTALGQPLGASGDSTSEVIDSGGLPAATATTLQTRELTSRLADLGGAVIDSFEAYTVGNFLSDDAAEWGHVDGKGWAPLKTTDDVVFEQSQTAGKSTYHDSTGYMVCQSTTNASTTYNQSATFDSYPATGDTIRSGVYMNVDNVYIDIGFGVPSDESNFNQNCYRIRGGTGQAPFIRKTVSGSSTALATSKGQLSQDTYYDWAISWEDTGSEVVIDLVIWEWDSSNSEWVQFDSITGTDSDRAFANDQGIAIAPNSDNSGDVIIADYFRFYDVIDETGEPVYTPDGSTAPEREGGFVDSGLTVLGEGGPLQTTETTAVVSPGGLTSATASLLDPKSISLLVDAAGLASASADMLTTNELVGGLESLNIAQNIETSFDDFGVAQEAGHAPAGSGYGNTYGDDYEGGDIIDLTETAIAIEDGSIPETVSPSLTGFGIASDRLQSSATASLQADDISVLIESGTSQAILTVSGEEWSRAREQLAIDIAAGYGSTYGDDYGEYTFTDIQETAIARARPASSAKATVSLIDTAPVIATLSIEADTEIKLTDFAPVVLNTMTAVANTGANVDDFSIATEDGTSAFSISVSGADLAIANEWSRMASNAAVDITELSIAFEQPAEAAEVAMAARDLALAFEKASIDQGGYATDYGGTYGEGERNLLASVEEYGIGKIINESGRSEASVTPIIYHGINLYHSVTGDSPSRVKYPRQITRYEEDEY